ncbi:hypothetical protein JCM33374_g2153 [Metschnikowia sp. JCM 33374]|nr:hypothetical protein JCM33374_g2153 [Metschnikowia sp. JCM 33374]
MPLKLKLKVNPSKNSTGNAAPDVQDPKPLPRLKLKHPSSSKEHIGSIKKPKAPKEKLKKLKISLGKPVAPSTGVASSSKDANGQVQPILKKVPKVRIKPTRVPGEGYDSEAPDVEDDPLLEQAIAVRFVNDANLDFLHSAADTGDFSNVNIKWITRDKAVVNVNSTLYSARLIDLPTLTELYKTVDKKNIFKTIDVSQILLVLRTINPKNLNMDTDFEVPEEYTYTHPLYKLSVNKEIRPTKTAYKHGLSNSFDDVYRRFRPKKVNHRLMTDIESRVDEIVRRDSEAQESHYEYVNPRSQPQRYADNSTPQTMLQRTASSISGSRVVAGSSDAPSDTAEAEIDDQDDDEDDQMALDLEADLDIALEQELADALDSTSNNTAATVLMKSEYDNDDEVDEGAVTGANDEDEADDDDDDEEDEDEEDEEDDEEDEEDETVKQDKSRVKKLEEEISDLQKAADKQKLLLATASYKMMRMKFQSAYNNLKSQLDQKKRELAKIREQQNKQQAPGQMESGPRRRAEDEEDEEEDEEDEVEDDEEVDEGADDQDKMQGVIEDASGGADDRKEVPQSTAEELEQQEDIAGLDDANDEDNYDDFQGLF